MEILLISAALVILLAAAGALYQRAGSLSDIGKFPPRGRLVDAGGRRLHITEAGQGNPVVVFESGIAASCLNWTAIQAGVARFTRTCAYDRAGLGWSDPAESPRDLARLIDELHGLLAAAGIARPYVLAGHSFGGLLVSAYAVKYPDEVAGLVLIDPLRPGEWLHLSEAQSRMLRRGVKLSRRGAMLARLGIVRLSLALLAGGARRIPKLVARISSGRGESTLSRLVGEVQKMPAEVWPIVQAHWCQPKCFIAMAQHLESLPASAGQAAQLADLPPIPISILSAGNSTTEQIAEREEMARRSVHGKHIVVTGSAHWIHLDQPEIVINTIREIVEWLRVAATPS